MFAKNFLKSVALLSLVLLALFFVPILLNASSTVSVVLGIAVICVCVWLSIIIIMSFIKNKK